ncbi:MAG: hypothetical protein CSA63_00840 [Propionibacterium sp.]|nr:MAG: hypothetical protein CSA63_00840 [Propionibacterium sp.]
MRRSRLVWLLGLGLVLGGCADGASLQSPSASNSAVAEPSGAAAATASPTVSAEPELVEPPETCLVSRPVPRSAFKTNDEELVLYSGDGLVVTEADGSILWEKDGKSGFIYENPGVTEDVEGKVDWDWDGSRLGLYSQSDGRFVVFDTMDLPYVGQPWQF